MAVNFQTPEYLNPENLPAFLAMLSLPLQPQEDAVLDLSRLRRVTPAGLVTLVATVSRWRREGHPFRFEGLQRCVITDYLKRMDVFKACGVQLSENFRRHESLGRFVPVRYIDHQVDQMGSDLSACLAPGGDDYEHPLHDLYDLAWYVLTETAQNVRQHSWGDGYVAAQVNPTEEVVRLAMADNGRGILKSFQAVDLPWSRGLDDAGAIRKALEPKVSSKGPPSNQGVGLTLVTRLVQLIGGGMTIVSGSGMMNIRRGAAPTFVTLPGPTYFQGTLLGLAFHQKDVQNFAGLLQSAKLDSGILQAAEKGIRFAP